jgi:hypothetical protein
MKVLRMNKLSSKMQLCKDLLPGNMYVVLLANTRSAVLNTTGPV